jgi:hypothetical protein
MAEAWLVESPSVHVKEVSPVCHSLQYDTKDWWVASSLRSIRVQPAGGVIATVLPLNPMQATIISFVVVPVGEDITIEVVAEPPTGEAATNDIAIVAPYL